MSPTRTKTRRKPIKLRTCVSCRRKAGKRELLRLVASAGAVSVDATGKLNGRGAYLCDECRADTTALRRGRLEYALRTKIPQDKWTVLLSEVDRV